MTRQILEQVFSKELIKALDNRAFIVGSDTNKIKYVIINSKNKAEIVNELNNFVKNGKIDYTKMGEISTLPPKMNYKSFYDDFKSDKNTKNANNNKIIFQTPAGDIRIYLPYAYNHFAKNGKFGNKKENRNNLTGALKEILSNPLFVTKDDKGSLYFYKAFKDEDKIIDIISVSVKSNGKIEYKTTYADKYNQILDLIEGYEVVYKASSG